MFKIRIMRKIIALLLVSLFLFLSCGPRRYKCGPYRKCETKSDIKKTSSETLKTYEVNA